MIPAELVSDMNVPTTLLSSAADSITTAATTATATSSNLLSFSDQGQNLAGIFFQASLLPYLAFLYFLSFRGNRTPNLGNFGWQYLLLFVLGTIPSGIITKSVYGQSLANTDWLHGGAEALLTITNVLIVSICTIIYYIICFILVYVLMTILPICNTFLSYQVLGFREAMTNPSYSPQSTSKYGNTPKFIAGGAALTFAAACALGTKLGFEGHSPFLFGLGNLPADTMASLSFITHAEPENALSIPTWTIHFSSVFEFLFAMDIIWKFAETTNNEKWKGLTWGMLPLHASGIAACTYHFFYNPSSLQFLVELQAFFTLLGNTTCAIAAYRIASSNGWRLGELNPLRLLPNREDSPEDIAIDEAAVLPYKVVASTESDLL